MARILIFIDHDIVLRHFVLNKILAPLEQYHDVTYVFPDQHKRVKTPLETLPVKRFCTVQISAERLQAYRLLYHASVVRMQRSKPDGKVVLAFWRDSLGPKAYREAWLRSLPIVYQFYRAKVLRKMSSSCELDALLEKEKPDLVLHPTVLEGLFVSDLVRWSEKTGKPTLFIMNSWDNAATKAMLVGHPTRLAVWGEQTKEHALHYLGIPEDRIVKLGAAQFDLYRRPPLESPESYRRRIGAPDGKRILLYAGSSKGLDETKHLQVLEEAVESGRLPNCFILYRPHPWKARAAGEQDMRALSWKHVLLAPEMADSYNRFFNEAVGSITLPDYEDTHTTLSAVDAVISPLSTILLEAAMHGKAVAAYLSDEDMQRNKFLFTTARMIHFREFFEKIDCVKCETADALVPSCTSLLKMTEQPGMGQRLRKQCEFFVQPSEHSFAERLMTCIDELCRLPQTAVLRAQSTKVQFGASNG